ncbi:MAG: nickel pincer cofactor biosynthesis protein LarB [Candidatus Omnitrophica bacterium]|nr:nickel pincer cofactor biosynthesis protein LarB [Candidatus Omnitrophota bacterium]
MPSNFLRKLLARHRKGALKTSDLIEELKGLPYRNLRFARVDLHRGLRRNFPEVIYAKGKTLPQIVAIAEELFKAGNPVVVTKLTPRLAGKLQKALPWIRAFRSSRMAAGPGAFFDRAPRRRGRGLDLLVVTAGTGDIPVAEEAALMGKLMGCRVERLFDVGVAGLHRILSARKLLWKARVIVVVAGMDGALPSVIGGLVQCPVIAVPTRTGYGASFRGVGPLLTMLNACSPGVAVVNIDNGFGAGYLAGMIIKAVKSEERLLYIEASAGASGDMLLAGFLDLGLPLDSVVRSVRALGLNPAGIRLRRVFREGVWAAQWGFAGEGPSVSRCRADRMIRRIEESSLSSPVKRSVIAVFTRLAKAEGEVHQRPWRRVFLSQLAQADALIDVAGFCAGLHHFKVEAVYTSPIPMGCRHRDGRGRCQETPGPAAARLLRRFKTVPRPFPFEWTTPTAAALVSTFGSPEACPSLWVKRVGHAVGTLRPPSGPSVLRMLLT